MDLNFLRGILICLVSLILLTNCDNTSNDESMPIEKILVDVGDSLTAGAGGEGNSMSIATSKLLGPEWTVENMGVGGENTLAIGARQGGIPMYIKESIVIPADGSKVEISTEVYSTYNDKSVAVMVQSVAGVNPCYIDGIECTLSHTLSSGKFYINRTKLGSIDYTTKPKSIIITSLSKEIKGIQTIFIGTNGGYDSPSDLLNQINLFVKHKGDNNVIIITSHVNGDAETIEPIKEKYGSKVIDLKKYMSTQAIYDAIDYGLLPNDGNYPTKEDLQAMANASAPPSLLSEGLHFNSIGYELLGRLRYKKGQELGYW